MDILEKPERRKVLGWLKYFLIPSLLILGFVMIFSGYQESVRYLDVRDRAVTVSATITHFVKYEDSKDTEYILYAKYTYIAEQYSTSYLTTTSYSKATSMIGQTVTFHINPDKPWEEVSDVKSGAVSLYCFGSLFAAAGVACCCIRERKHFVEAFGWTRQNVHSDLNAKIRRKMASWLFFGISGICLLGAWFLHEHTLHLVFGLIFIVIAARSLGNWCKMRKYIQNGDYRLARETLTEKTSNSDGDGGRNYYLHFSDGENTRRCAVNYKRYNSAQEGETQEEVYLPGRKRPFFVYSAVTRQAK